MEELDKRYFLDRFVISLSVEHSAWKISCSFIDFSSSISSVIVVSCWFNFICWMGFKIRVFSFSAFSSFRSVTLALSFFLTVLYLFSIGLKWFIRHLWYRRKFSLQFQPFRLHPGHIPWIEWAAGTKPTCGSCPTAGTNPWCAPTLMWSGCTR